MQEVYSCIQVSRSSHPTETTPLHCTKWILLFYQASKSTFPSPIKAVLLFIKAHSLLSRLLQTNWPRQLTLESYCLPKFLIPSPENKSISSKYAPCQVYGLGVRMTEESGLVLSRFNALSFLKIRSPMSISNIIQDWKNERYRRLLLHQYSFQWIEVSPQPRSLSNTIQSSQTWLLDDEFSNVRLRVDIQLYNVAPSKSLSV